MRWQNRRWLWPAIVILTAVIAIQSNTEAGRTFVYAAVGMIVISATGWLILDTWLRPSRWKSAIAIVVLLVSVVSEILRVRSADQNYANYPNSGVGLLVVVLMIVWSVTGLLILTFGGRPPRRKKTIEIAVLFVSILMACVMYLGGGREWSAPDTIGFFAAAGLGPLTVVQVFTRK